MNLTGQKGFIGVEIDNASIQGLLRDLKGYEKESENAINKAIAQTSLAIQTDAKNRLREYLTNIGEFLTDKKTGKKAASMRGHGGSGLVGSIYNRVVKSMEKIVGSDKHYAPYIEFGTGEKVFTNYDFDDEAKKVAAQFKGKKKVKGIRGVSFLNWAAVNQEKKHIERIETELNKINK